MSDDILSKIGYSYGTLNAVQPKKSTGHYNNTMDPLDLLRNNIKEFFSDKATSGITQFKAIVLRIETPPGLEGEGDPMGWSDMVADIFSEGEPEIPLISVRAMIPEIHGAILPTPASLGDEFGGQADNAVIDLYPLFTAENAAKQMPKIGDVVWVTFEDIENLQGGIYLGGLNEQNQNPPHTAAKPACNFRPCGDMISRGAGGNLSIKGVNAKIVADFPDLQNTRTPIDPNKDRGKLPVGKGIFTNMPATGRRFSVAKASQMGLDWVCLAMAWWRHPDSSKGNTGTIHPQKGAHYIAEFKKKVAEFNRAGIRVYGWGYPSIHYLDEFVSHIFPLAAEAGCCGVLSDPEYDMKYPKAKMEEVTAKVKAWTNNCMKAARQYGLCYGMSSYEIPSFQPRLPFAAFGPADFVIPQSYRAYPEYKINGMLRGISDYEKAGFKNILVMGGLYGKENPPRKPGLLWRQLYPQYETKMKPPEATIRRSSWLFSDSAQKMVDYKKAVDMWSWEALGGHFHGHPMNRVQVLTNLADEIRKLKSGVSETNPASTDAEKEVSSASADEKKEKEDNVSDTVRNSENRQESAREQENNQTTREQSAEADQAMKQEAEAPTKPQLTPEQQAELDNKRKQVDAQKQVVENLEIEVEGLTGTALPGDDSHKLAQQKQVELRKEKQTLQTLKKELVEIEKRLGVKSKAQPSSGGGGFARAASTAGMCSNPCAPGAGGGRRAGGGGNGGGGGGGGGADLSWLGESGGFENLTEYKTDNTTVTLEPATPYKENRVRNGVYPQKFLKPELLTNFKGKVIHVLAAKRLELCLKQMASDIGIVPRLASGLREEGAKRYAWLRQARGQRYVARKGPKKGQKVVADALAADPNVSTEALFDLWLEGQYGSKRTGRIYRAYNSPHESGCAFDFSYGSAHPDRWSAGSMGPYSKTNDKQMQGKLFKWLRRHAHKWGITPYKGEAWHWEIQMPRKAWRTGEDWVTDGNYAVYVVEKSNETGVLTSDAAWAGRAFK